MDFKKYSDSIPKLNEMVRYCPHLQSINLLVDQSSKRIAQDHLDAWLSQNVQKVNSMKLISIQNNPLGYLKGEVEDISGLLRYLSFKYPKVEYVNMDYYQQKDQAIAHQFLRMQKPLNCRIGRLTLSTMLNESCMRGKARITQSQ